MMQCCLKHAKHLPTSFQSCVMTCLPHVSCRPAARLLQSSHELSRPRSDSIGVRPRLANKPLPYCHPRHNLTAADSADDCVQAWGQPAANLLEHPTQVSIALPLHWLCCTVKVFSVSQSQQDNAVLHHFPVQHTEAWQLACKLPLLLYSRMHFHLLHD